MISTERRRHALGVAASLTLHALAFVALQARGTTDHHVGPPAEETVLEVTWWAGAEGQAASPAPSEPPMDAPPATADPTPPVDPAPPPHGETTADRSEQQAAIETSTTALRPPLPEVETPNPDHATEPRRDEATARRGSTDRRSPSAPKRKGVERRDRRAPTDGETSTTPPATRNGRTGAPGPRVGGGPSTDLGAYLARVRARIASRQSAPAGEQGRVGIRFDVAGDGSFSGLAVVAGDRGPLADTALRIVRRASPAPPISPALGRDSIAMSVTIVFE